MIKNRYTGLTTARIVTDRTGEYFNTENGIKQGEPLSSPIFIAALKETFKKVRWEGKGVSINREFLNHLRFTDDVVLTANNKDELKSMVEELNNAEK